MNSKYYYQSILWSLAINIFIGLIGSNIKSHNAKPKQQTTFKKINFDKQLKPEYNDSL
jgi:hypothetical protein